MLNVSTTAEVLDQVRVDEVPQIFAFRKKRVVDVVKVAAGRTVPGLEVKDHVRHANELAVTAPALDPSDLMCNHMLIEVVLVDTVLIALAARDNDI